MSLLVTTATMQLGKWNFGHSVQTSTEYRQMSLTLLNQSYVFSSYQITSIEIPLGLSATIFYPLFKRFSETAFVQILARIHTCKGVLTAIDLKQGILTQFGARANEHI